MSRDTRNSNSSSSSASGEEDMEHFLKINAPTNQIVAVLKGQKKDQAYIDNYISKYEASKKRIRSMVKRFIEKIREKYGDLEVPDLFNKGLRFAAKHNFTDAEKEAFQSFVLKGDFDTPYHPFEEITYTEMYKFLGYSAPAYSQSPMLDIKSADQSTLNEIIRLFDTTRVLHTNVKNQMYLYRDCAPEAISGIFDSQRHNVSMFIHPVIFAAFIPKIKALERRMIMTNLGRVVAHRSAPYVKRNLNSSDAQTGEELVADKELTLDIARDPNSLQYFSEDTPLSNLHKRFKIQIELWKNIMSLRQGRYYSSGDSDVDDNVTGFMKILNSYDWTFFDSPDLYQVQDEGTVLRKLLSVFSLRPTLTRLTSFTPANMDIYNNNVHSLSNLIYVQTPIVNFKLPPRENTFNTLPFNQQQVNTNLRLEQALEQLDYYVISRSIVPKKKNILNSKDLLLFYINRKYPVPNYVPYNANEFTYIDVVPIGLSTMTQINNINVTVPTVLSNIFSSASTNAVYDLRSFVAVEPITMPQSYETQTRPVLTSAGCSAFVYPEGQQIVGQPSNSSVIRYTPHLAAIKNPSVNGRFDEARESKLVTIMEDPMLNGSQTFVGTPDDVTPIKETLGTIFLYVARP